MKNRQQLEIEIAEKEGHIQKLLSEIIELQKEAILLCDDKQWFTEEIEAHPKKRYERKANYLDGKLVGRRHWNEDFKDENTGEVITIERSDIVRLYGKWSSHAIG